MFFSPSFILVDMESSAVRPEVCQAHTYKLAPTVGYSKQ